MESIEQRLILVNWVKSLERPTFLSSLSFPHSLDISNNAAWHASIPDILGNLFITHSPRRLQWMSATTEKKNTKERQTSAKRRDWSLFVADFAHQQSDIIRLL